MRTTFDTDKEPKKQQSKNPTPVMGPPGFASPRTNIPLRSVEYRFTGSSQFVYTEKR